jgi:hypothetical protein
VVRRGLTPPVASSAPSAATFFLGGMMVLVLLVVVDVESKCRWKVGLDQGCSREECRRKGTRVERRVYILILADLDPITSEAGSGDTGGEGECG